MCETFRGVDPGTDTIALARDKWAEHGWADVADGMAAVTSIMRAQQILQARVDQALRPFNLTFARYEVLMLLHFSSRGSMPLKNASQRLQVHHTSITNAVDRLETAHLVTRRPHPDDHRATLVAITPKGRRTALTATDTLNTQVFAQPGLTPHDTTTLISLLRDLRHDAGGP